MPRNRLRKTTPQFLIHRAYGVWKAWEQERPYFDPMGVQAIKTLLDFWAEQNRQARVFAERLPSSVMPIPEALRSLPLERQDLQNPSDSIQKRPDPWFRPVLLETVTGNPGRSYRSAALFDRPTASPERSVVRRPRKR